MLGVGRLSAEGSRHHHISPPKQTNTKPNQGSTTPEDYTGGRDAEGIVKFVNDKAGLSRKVKKAPSAVVTLTPANFDSVVDGSKHVLAKFYAPWW